MAVARSFDAESFSACSHPVGSVLLRLRWPRAFSIESCDRCGAIFTSPRPEDMDAVELYDSSEGAWQHEQFDRCIRPARLASYRKALDKLDSLQSSGRLLDVGSGYGDFLKMAQAAGWTGTGLELSRYKVELSAAAGLDVRQLTLDQAAFEASSFDAVTLWDVLEHVPDPVAMLSECARVLRPGGALLVRSPNGDAVSWAAASRLRPFWLVYLLGVFPLVPRQHIHHFTAGALTDLVSLVGFDVLDVDTDESRDARLVRMNNMLFSFGRMSLAYLGWRLRLPFETVVIARR